jgi:glycosyltransferase involved in cell wall biosynthesis
MILNIARLHEEKGQDLLVKACRILADKGLKFDCYIVGGGERREYLCELIRQLDLGSLVHLPGAVPQEGIRDYFERADVFVLPSRRENLPNVLVESLAMEVPVVASHIAGIPELVEEGITGFLVPPNDIQRLAEAVSRLLEDEDLRAKFARRGRELVCSRFEIERSNDQIVELYRRNGLLECS